MDRDEYMIEPAVKKWTSWEVREIESGETRKVECPECGNSNVQHIVKNPQLHSGIDSENPVFYCSSCSWWTTVESWIENHFGGQ
jgi:late competence protein required for DNA uptake (superfamily II DNA/RNA helicase)